MSRIPFVSEQIHYSLQAREAEYELIPDRDRPEARAFWRGPDRRRAAQRQVPPQQG